jgi:hypothetical protein
MLQNSIACVEQLRVCLFCCGEPLPEAKTDHCVLIGFFFSTSGRSFSKPLDTMGEAYWPVGCYLVRRFPWLQDEEELCDFPLCQEVPFEQDSSEYLGKIFYCNGRQFFKNFASDEVQIR